MNNTEIERFKEIYNGIDSNTIKDENMRVLLAASRTDVNPENSNGIVVYTGSYKKIKNKTFLTYEGDLKAVFKRYMDIETGELHQINLSDVEEFEKNHIVIKHNIEFENMQIHDKNYDETRVEFFKGIMNEPQEAVVLRLQNRRDQ